VAQGYPSQVVRIIVPFPAGGSTDTYARIVANELRGAFDKSVIVENRAGATGAIGTQAVRQSAPDGYALLFTSNTAHVFSPVMQNPRPFDPVADFTPVSVAVEGVYVWLGLLGPAGLPPAVVGTLGDEIARIMRLPGIRKRVLNDGYEAVGNTPQQFKESIVSEVTAASRLIREIGIKAK